MLTFTSHAPRQTFVLHKSVPAFLDESSFAVSALPAVPSVDIAAKTSLEGSEGEIDEKMGG